MTAATERPYHNWRRERVEYIGHFHDLRRRADLLQERLDFAQANIAKLQAKELKSRGYDVSSHDNIGGIVRHNNKWRAYVNAAGAKLWKNGFSTDEEARGWLAEMDQRLGLSSYKETVNRMRQEIRVRAMAHKAGAVSDRAMFG